MRVAIVRLGPLVGLVVGLVFLWLALRDADLKPALTALRDADPAWCLTVFVSGLAFMAIKTLRWQWLLAPVARPSFGAMHEAIYIGSAANLVVPHVGELLRARLLARSSTSTSTVTTSTALGSVAIERILDMIAVVLIGLPVLLLDARVPPAMWSAALAALTLAVGGAVVVLDAMTSTGRLRRLGRWVAGHLPAQGGARLARLAAQVTAGFGTVADRRRLGVALVLSLLQWALVVLAIWASARAAGVELSLSISVTVFVLSVVGLTLPSAPAALGTTQLAFVIGLGMAGIPAIEALTSSFVYSTCFIIALMLVGGGYWLVSELRRLKSRARA